MTRRLTLVEYGICPAVRLSSEERLALQALVPSLDITPSKDDGRFDLGATSWIGAIALNDLRIEILPKIPISRVLFLLSYALDPRQWQDVGFDFGVEDSLLAAIIPGFVYQARHALARGLLHGYRSEEDALTTVRGRLRFDDQIRHHYGRFPPIEVRYDEFTADIDENRLLKAATACLLQLAVRSPTSRQNLAALAALLESVRLIHFNPRWLPEIQYTRLNVHYRPAVELARLILRAATIELRHGAVRSSAFLVNMNAVFEEFIVVALREALKLSAREFPRGANSRALYLDQNRAIPLKPDLSWWDGAICRFVGDVKYKRARADGVLHPDVYQILAYTIATDLPSGLLIYAAGEAEPATHVVARANKTVTITTVDLSRSPSEILDQISGIAERLRTTARESSAATRTTASQ